MFNGHKIQHTIQYKQPDFQHAIYQILDVQLHFGLFWVGTILIMC